ncbi:MAG: hypothetical protein QM401_07525, partial [Bacillota bacterium]|nr:hypothetical protein [Bacillota bacterium]
AVISAFGLQSLQALLPVQLDVTPQCPLGDWLAQKTLPFQYLFVNSRIELAFFLTVFWAVLTRGKRAILTLF